VAGGRSQYAILAIFMWFYLANVTGGTYVEAVKYFYVGLADDVHDHTWIFGDKLHNLVLFGIAWFHLMVIAWIYNARMASERLFVGHLAYHTKDMYGHPTDFNFLGVYLQMKENPNPLKYSGYRTVNNIYLNAVKSVYASIRAGSVAHNNLARFANADLSRLVGPDADPIGLANSALYLEQWIEVGNCVFRTGDDKIPNMRY
jgi:hypothetical protein